MDFGFNATENGTLLSHTGWGKGWNVTSAGSQVTLCDPIWHVSSSSGEACCELLYPVTLLYFTSVGQRQRTCGRFQSMSGHADGGLS